MADLIELATEGLARGILETLGGRWELAARFERPLEILADDYFRERVRANLETAARHGVRRVGA